MGENIILIAIKDLAKHLNKKALIGVMQPEAFSCLSLLNLWNVGQR
jgi:hypothetical protein